MRKLITSIFFLSLLAVVILSCRKEPDLIGLDLIPESDLLGHEYTDTVTIVAYTLAEDSTRNALNRTDEMIQHLVGSIADPVFGTTTASIYTQFLLSRVNPSFGTTPVADSIILTIPYSGIYGDTLATQHIKVYEVTDTMNVNSGYYYFSTKSIGAEPIGEATFIPNTWEVDTIDGNAVRPHLKVQLSNEFAQKFFTTSITNNKAFSSDDEFVKVFKGIFITAEKAAGPESGAIMYLNLTHTQSQITLYYKNSTEDSLSFEFPISTNSARFNHYEHYGYEGADPLLAAQLAGDTTAGNERLFLQSMLGTRIKLQFPFIDDLASRKIAIHEAVLMFDGPQTDSTYAIPSTLTVKAVDSAGNIETLPDEMEGATYMGTTPKGPNQYRVRIGRYIQQRLIHPERPDYGIYIMAGNPWIFSNRAQFYGPGSSISPLKLRIYFTPIK